MAAKLVLEPNLLRPDDIYDALMALHRDRSPEESQKINAKLILLLANHIGDHDVLDQAIALAAGATESFAEK